MEEHRKPRQFLEARPQGKRPVGRLRTTWEEEEDVLLQSNRYWSRENPRHIHEILLHDELIEIWCAVNGYRIIGPIFEV